MNAPDPGSASAPGPEGPRAPAVAWLLALVGVAGACTLVVELAAVRLLAPWFGASASVWTNVIGVILLSLSLGYLAGARLAARPRPERALGIVLIAAGLCAAWLPLFAAPVCARFLPPGLGLHQAVGLLLWGSLAAALALFLPPAALLGCVGPLAVELLQVRRGFHAGTAGGIVLCVSTLGALAGTFATTHLLIPRLGLSLSFVLSGAALVVLGAATLALSSRRAHLPAVLALLAAGAAVPSARLSPPAPMEGMALLERAESIYQSLRVVEDSTLAEPLRLLQVNEGLDSFQSVWRAEPGLLGQGFYYDYFALPAWWARAAGRWKVLVLGLGAGTTWRVLEGASPPGIELESTGVELDARVVELGQRWFELPLSAAGRKVVAGADARQALRALATDFDLVVLDVYAHQIEIPAHLSSVEFFREVRAHLAPGGYLALNAGGFGADDPVVSALGRTLARAFEECLALRVPRARNWVLLARREGALPAPDASQAGRGPDWELEAEVPRQLLGPLSLPGSVARFSDDPRASVLTDDRNPMEQLQIASLRQVEERLGGVP